jgi:DNA-binding transcriptional ArsR family regulator
VTRSDPSDARAGEVFAALADPTRRAVLRSVADEGPCTATELAARLPVSRQAIAKHLGILRAAGLVATQKAGREQQFTVTADRLLEAGTWLTRSGTAWDERLGRLERLARPRSRSSKGANGG